jgi:hypothetical protein
MTVAGPTATSDTAGQCLDRGRHVSGAEMEGQSNRGMKMKEGHTLQDRIRKNIKVYMIHS